MDASFTDMLAVGGRSNSLGRVDEVIALVLQDESRLGELYTCLFHEDAWVRMRAADALEKVCRQRPGWLVPYIDALQRDLAASTQPSIRWHLAQVYQQVELTDPQRRSAIAWLRQQLASEDVDWIVAANAMAALAHFTREGHVPAGDLVALLEVQQRHKSKAVVKRAATLLDELSAS